MAVSAFKSTSKRSNLTTPSSSSSTSRTNRSSETGTTDNSLKKAPPRRSRSVSALSRTQPDVASEFLNKRDNPLFWNSGSPPDGEIRSQNADENAKSDGILSSKSSVESRRGRSVSRNVDAGKKSSGIGRSLSRVDTGRRGRSVSSHHYDSEVELEYDGLLPNLGRSCNLVDVATNFGRNADMVRSSFELLDCSKSPRTPLVASDSSAVSLQIHNRHDGALIGTFSEAEEKKTIKAVREQRRGDSIGDDTATSGIYETVRSEVRRAIVDIQNDLESAIRRNNTTPIATANVADALLDSVNPGAVEFVLDIRREYAKELEQSNERARELRADLAVEEQRGQELSRILKELLPEQKTPSLQGSRPGRKNSSERRRMSKRLAEEAMAYFDECVSISTFDGSDFSSLDDPPLSLIGDTASLGDSVPLNRDTGPDSTKIEQGPKFQFSFAREPVGTFGGQQGIGNYVLNLEKGTEKDGVNSETVKINYYDFDEYNLQVPVESFLFDRVLFKRRIETGSLLLCGNFPVSFSPFASII